MSILEFCLLFNILFSLIYISNYAKLNNSTDILHSFLNADNVLFEVFNIEAII